MKPASLINTAINTVASYLFSAPPLFMLMGDFASSSGLIRDGYLRMIVWIRGHLHGELAMASIGKRARFVCVSGSIVVTAMTMTRFAPPEMLEALQQLSQPQSYYNR